VKAELTNESGVLFATVHLPPLATEQAQSKVLHELKTAVARGVEHKKEVQAMTNARLSKRKATERDDHERNASSSVSPHSPPSQRMLRSATKRQKLAES
jgi:hypothetical protein